MSVEEYVQISGKLVELGGRLKTLKTSRDSLNKEIEELETEVRPLVVRHAELLADALGTPVQSLALPVSAGPVGPDGQPPPPQEKQVAKIKERLKKYLENAQPGISAADIAEALHLDVALVRSAMGEMLRAQH